MKILDTFIPGIKIISGDIFKDTRGEFLKVFNGEIFKKELLDIDVKEIYFSISNKNVIRGMHFQAPPEDHIKIVYVSKGSIIDVLLDLRKNSPTYKKYLTIPIDSRQGKIVYIPSGVAHGFLSTEDNTIVNYIQNSYYSKEHDSGILYNSFGYDWESVISPTISERDLLFPALDNFSSPFN